MRSETIEVRGEAAGHAGGARDALGSSRQRRRRRSTARSRVDRASCAARRMFACSISSARNHSRSVLDAANRAGAPAQNFLAVDARRPHRLDADGSGARASPNYESTMPASWRAPQHGLDRLARARGISAHRRSAHRSTVDREHADDRRGNVACVHGRRRLRSRRARARRSATTCWRCSRRAPADMLAIQLDDRALFLTRWRDLLARSARRRGDRGRAAPRGGEALHREWSGRAAADDVGYRSCAQRGCRSAATCSRRSRRRRG